MELQKANANKKAIAFEMWLYVRRQRMPHLFQYNSSPKKERAGFSPAFSFFLSLWFFPGAVRIFALLKSRKLPTATAMKGEEKVRDVIDRQIGIRTWEKMTISKSCYCRIHYMLWSEKIHPLPVWLWQGKGKPQLFKQGWANICRR